MNPAREERVRAVVRAAWALLQSVDHRTHHEIARDASVLRRKLESLDYQEWHQRHQARREGRGA